MSSSYFWVLTRIQQSVIETVSGPVRNVQGAGAVTIELLAAFITMDLETTAASQNFHQNFSC